MVWKSTADKVGVNMAEFESLMRGVPTPAVANKLGLSVGDLECFIAGKASSNVQHFFDIGPMAAPMELAQIGGSQFASGVIFGLLLAAAKRHG